MKSNFVYNMLFSAVQKGYKTVYIDLETDSNYWMQLKNELLRDERKDKLEELFPDIKNNNEL